MITIGITSYNCEDTICDAIESALSQDWSNYEIIIVDDCSNDLTWSLICRYRSSNIFLYRNDINRGVSFSRSRIVDLASGKLLCFIDDDDFSSPSRLSKQYATICSAGFPSVDNLICMCGMRRKYSSGFIKKFSPLGTLGFLPSSEQLIDFLLFNKRVSGVDYGFCCPTSACMIPTSFIRSVGSFDPSFRRVEDVDLTIRLCLSGAIFCSVPEFLVTQISTPGSDKSHFRNYLSELSIVNKFKEYLVQKRMYNYAKFSTSLRFAYFSKQFFAFVLYALFMILSRPFYALRHISNSSFNRFVHEVQILWGSR